MPESPDPETTDRLLGLSEVADLLLTSRTTVANWRARPATPFLDAARFSEADRVRA